MNKKIFCLCILSSLFLAFSYPRFNFEFLAWAAFIPLFFAIENQTKRKAFWFSYFSGFVFFISLLYWLVHVTLTGLILLCLYLSFYFAFFGYFFVSVRKRLKVNNISCIIFLSSIWVILEYLRSQLLSGFPWALLGYSQYLNIGLIQFVDIIGSFGLSFFVVFVNLCLFELIRFLRQRNYRLFIKFSFILALLFITIYSYGAYCVKEYSKNTKKILNVSLIQGNIPQEEKWLSSSREKIKETYYQLSKEAALENPDLIIWPETAYPDYIIDGEEQTISPLLELVKDIDKPILFGSVYQKEDKYFNSAILVSDDLKSIINYKKIHLVPFGEFLPLRKQIFFLEKVVPIEDFTAGSEHTIFKIENANKREFSTNDREYSRKLALSVNSQSGNSREFASTKFGVLVCFEDTISELSRALKLRGADFLVNMTNDAWFKKTSSPYQHMQASVFRAVENRVFMLRAANTGVSCIIDNCGRIIKRFKGSTGRDIFVEGFITGKIEKHHNLSFYTKFGDIIILLCAVYVLLFALYIKTKLVL